MLDDSSLRHRQEEQLDQYLHPYRDAQQSYDNQQRSENYQREESHLGSTPTGSQTARFSQIRSASRRGPERGTRSPSYVSQSGQAIPPINAQMQNRNPRPDSVASQQHQQHQTQQPAPALPYATGSRANDRHAEEVNGFQGAQERREDAR